MRARDSLPFNSLSELVLAKTYLLLWGVLGPYPMRLWQLDNAKSMDAPVTFAEIVEYLAEGVSTNCPSGGLYVVTGLTNPPMCTFPGHALSNEGGD